MRYMIRTNDKNLGYDIVESNGNVQLNAWGKTLKELFRNALRGLTAYIKPNALAVSNKEPKEKHALRVEAVDLNSLLIEFLTSVIAAADFRGLAFTHVAFKTLGDNFLEAELSGVATNTFDQEVKAVSYSEVDIRHSPESGLYETTLVFEV